MKKDVLLHFACTVNEHLYIYIILVNAVSNKTNLEGKDKLVWSYVKKLT